MDIQQAKKTVCEAGIKLLKEGLVARTWGNISVRVDDDSFVITPSGRTYEDLTPDDIVLVKIADLSYDSHIKPSSEKGLHAEVYKLDRGIGAVVHTHQMNASTVAAARKEVPAIDDEMARLVGSSVRVAPYALPGTGKLARGTAAALQGRKAALMANHGAVCAGADMNEAFMVSKKLEEMCAAYIEKQYMKEAGESGAFDVKRMHEYYLKKYAKR
ncbi:MAG: class II aldolase family protein [Spirochaetae bacterium HGW-Spirochaetae-1]|jgi:L-fuculose-phosphate aldolase|nr:MAG: class II aldolase family protein [Spirochaetae bacterium HGW-Spirochaetae-1]